ncbi:MAG TPA: hypothetical protein VJ083_03710 [Sedimentibacter sp.]|nr:hypothetical protein [Sedimentibacter sp.]
MEKTTIIGDLVLTGSQPMINKLEKMMNVKRVELKTVRSLIENEPNRIISKRISKKGIALVTIQLPNETKELQEERILNGKEFYL